MKDLTIFHLPSNGGPDSIVYDGTQFFNSLHVKKSLDDLGVSYDFITCSADTMPNRVESSLVLIFDNSTYIPSDFIFNAITLNNLYRDAGILFGPKYTTNENKDVSTRYIQESYHKYDINFGDSVVCDITKEPHNYGSLVGSVISGPAYNRTGYYCSNTPRGFSVESASFCLGIAKKYKIYHCSNLTKVKRFCDSDFSPDVVSEYYYNMGYQEGASMSMMDDSSKLKEVWKRFVESPELLDYNQPRWLFEESVSSEYVEFLALLKCKYSIGIFEGMMGKKLI